MALDFLGGAGAGAADGLMQLITQQLREQIAQQEMSQRQQGLDLESQRLNEQIRANAADEADRTRQREVEATARRDATNQKGVRRMAADFILQRNGNLTPEDRRGVAALQIEADGSFDPRLLQEPEVKRHPMTVRGPNGQPMRRLVTEDELMGGVEEYREPRAATGQAPEAYKLMGPNGEQRIVRGDDAANQLMSQGWKMYDATAVRQSNTPATQGQAQETAAEVARVARQLLGHGGFQSAFGVLDSRFPTIRQSTADAEGLRNTLTSLLTLENMGVMKGVLSDNDMKIIRQASSLLGNERLGDAAARQELERLIPIMEKVAGVQLTQPGAQRFQIVGVTPGGQ